MSRSQSGNTMVILLIGVVVILAAGVFYYVNSRSVVESPGTDTIQEAQPGTDVMNTQDLNSDLEPTLDPNQEMTSTDATVKEFTLEAGSFYYEPNVIRVKKGDMVRVTINSVDMMHDFKIDELNVASEIYEAGESGSVEFTADTVGEFEFYCSVGQHRANGMVGTLIVEE